MAGGDIDRVLDRIARSRFRSGFHLRSGERSQVAAKGVAVMRMHAADIVARRLADAHPASDGRQTPWGGHPVFRAQHATGTCCRGCLHRLHGIAAGRVLDDEETAYVVAVIVRWIERECAGPLLPSRPAAARRRPVPGDGRADQPRLF